MAYSIRFSPETMRFGRDMRHRISKLNVTFRKISSGLRVTQAADDASGLGIAERLESQIKETQTEIRGSTDQISMLQTLDGSLALAQERLLQMRELATKAANDSNSFIDRQALTEEFQNLMRELDEIADNAKYNGRKLLDSHEPLTLSLDYDKPPEQLLTRTSLRPESLGRQSSHTSLRRGVFLQALNSGEVTINGVAIRGTSDVDDKLSYLHNEGSALAKAKAINHSTEFTGVDAWVEDNVVVGVEPLRELDFNTGHWLKVNGWAVSGFKLEAKDATGTLEQHINWGHEESGVKATVDGEGRLILFAEDGRNITVEYSDDNVRDALRVIDIYGDEINLADSVDSPDYEHNGDIIGVEVDTAGINATITSDNGSGVHLGATDYADYYVEIIEPGQINQATYRIKRENLGDKTTDIADESDGENGLFNARGVLTPSDPLRVKQASSGSYYNSASDREYTVKVVQAGDPKSGLVGDKPKVSVFERNVDIDGATETLIAHLQNITVSEGNKLNVGNGALLEIEGTFNRTVGGVTLPGTNASGHGVNATPQSPQPFDHDYQHKIEILNWHGSVSTDFAFEIKPGDAGHSLGSSAGGGRAQLTVTAFQGNTYVDSQSFDFNPDVGDDRYEDYNWNSQGLRFRLRAGDAFTSRKTDGRVQSETLNTYNGAIQTDGEFAHDEDRKYVLTVKQDAVFNVDDKTTNFTVQTFEDSDNDGAIDDLVDTAHNQVITANEWFELGTVSHQGRVQFAYAPVEISQTANQLVEFSNDSYTTPVTQNGEIRVTQAGALGSALYDYYLGGVRLGTNQTLKASDSLASGIKYSASAPPTEVNSTNNPGGKLQVQSEAYTQNQEGDFTINIEEFVDNTDPLNPITTHFYSYQWTFADGSFTPPSAQQELFVNQNINLGEGVVVRFTSLPADGSVYTGQAKPPHFEMGDSFTFTVDPKPLKTDEKVTLFYEATDFAEGAYWELEAVNNAYWNVGEEMRVNAVNNYDTAEQTLTSTITYPGDLMGDVELSGTGTFQTGDQVRIKTRGYIGEISSRGEYTKSHYPTDYIFTVTKGGAIKDAEIDWKRKDVFVDGITVPDLEFSGQGTLNPKADKFTYIEHGLEINIGDVVDGNGNSVAYLAEGDIFKIAVGKKLKYTFSSQLTLKSEENIQVDYDIGDITGLSEDDIIEKKSVIDNKLGRLNFLGTEAQANQAGDKELTLSVATHGKSLNHSLDTMNLLSRGAIRAAIHTIDLSIKQLSEDRTIVGTAMNRVEHKTLALTQKSLDLLGIHMRLTGADMAQETANYAAEQLKMVMTPFLLENTKLRSLVALDLIDRRQGGRF